MKKNSGFFEKIYCLDELKRPYDYPLAKRPFTVDVELTNHCNLLCVFCDRQLMKRAKGFMDFAVLKKIVDQAAEIGVLGIRFIRWGEPLLHPKVFEAVKYIKSKGLLAHITTNGLLVDEKMAEQIVESGLDNIIFSMQGLDEKGYLEMRRVKAYGAEQHKMLLKNINGLLAVRKKMGADRPYIQVTTTTMDETEEQIKEWREGWNNKVDLATHTGVTSLFRVRNCSKVKPLLNRVKFWKRDMLCHEVLTKMAVNWNGDFTACANDYDNFMILGNIKKMTMKQAWHSAKLNYYRGILKRNDLKEINKKIPYCGYCRNRF